MNDEFLLALKRLETNDPKSVVERVTAFFSTISTLDGPAVIAAYQTHHFLFSGVKISDSMTEYKVKQIRNALINRMQVIVAMAPEQDRGRTAAVFTATLGGKMYAWRFEEILSV